MGTGLDAPGPASLSLGALAAPAATGDECDQNGIPACFHQNNTLAAELEPEIKPFVALMRPGDIVLSSELSTDFRDPSLQVFMLARRIDLNFLRCRRRPVIILVDHVFDRLF